MDAARCLAARHFHILELVIEFFMASSSDPLLVIENLVAGYGKLPVLHDLSLSVARGSLTTIVGPNGAGKTTLVKALVNIVDVTAGKIVFVGKTISGLPTHLIVAEGIGFVPQTANVFATLTVQENLEMGCRFVPEAGRADAIAMAYQRFPRLRERRRQRARTLSGGERQMLAISSALLADPALLILDEPVTGLSPQLTDEVVGGIKQINAKGTTILWVVEENPLQVLAIADWVHVMEAGRIKNSMPAAELLEAPDFRQIFLGV
jgi:ABC-type branched-subunit amino acid transport system ATPase component